MLEARCCRLACSVEWCSRDTNSGEAASSQQAKWRLSPSDVDAAIVPGCGLAASLPGGDVAAVPGWADQHLVEAHMRG